MENGWVVCSHAGELIKAKDFLGGVLFRILVDDVWSRPIYAPGFKVRLRAGDMDDNGFETRS